MVDWKTDPQECVDDVVLGIQHLLADGLHVTRCDGVDRRVATTKQKREELTVVDVERTIVRNQATHRVRVLGCWAGDVISNIMRLIPFLFDGVDPTSR